MLWNHYRESIDMSILTRRGTRPHVTSPRAPGSARRPSLARDTSCSSISNGRWRTPGRRVTARSIPSSDAFSPRISSSRRRPGLGARRPTRSRIRASQRFAAGCARRSPIGARGTTRCSACSSCGCSSPTRHGAISSASARTGRGSWTSFARSTAEPPGGRAQERAFRLSLDGGIRMVESRIEWLEWAVEQRI